MKNKSWLVLSLIIVATIVVFFPALDGVYLNLDDNQQITNNQDVLNLSWQSVKNYFTSFYVASYQPLASLSFGIEYYLFGENSLIPHIINLLLHLLNIILVYFLLRNITKNQLINFFIVGVFAIHPLQAELLGWISTRSTLLYSSFFLLSSIYYIKYISKKHQKYYWITLVFFVLSLFSKATAVIFPFLLLLFDYLFKRKFKLKVVLEKIPFFIGVIVIGMVSLVSRGVTENKGNFDEYFSLYEKLSITSFSVFQYLQKSFFPEDLIFFYGYPIKLIETGTIDISFLLGPLWILLIGIFCWIIYKYSSKDNKRLWLFGLGFFLVNISIVVNVTSFSATYFAERYMYIAILGVFIALSILIQGLIKTSPILKNATYVLLGVFFIILAVKARERSSLWTTDLKLWSFVEKTGLQNSTPYRKLGQIYANKENHQKAVEIYNRGVKVNPYSADLYYWRALSIVSLGDLEYAKKDLGRVISSNDQLKGDAFYQKSLIFEKQGLLDSVKTNLDSARFYKIEKAIFDSRTLPTNFGQLEKAKQRILKRVDSLIQVIEYKKAISEYENLLLLSPDNPDVLLEKGKLEVQTNQLEKAITSFNKLLKLDSKNKIALLSRAYAFFNISEHKKAIKDYTFIINNFKDTTGEVYYFRGLSYLNSKMKLEGCNDINKSITLGFKVPEEIKSKCTKK